MMLVKPVETGAELESAHRIRKTVFVEEQNCPEEIEWEFEDESHHFIAVANGEAVGTARWRETENGFKLERFAVLQPWRGKGVGDAILTVILNDVPQNNRPVYLHAQLTARNFYLKHGFEPVGNHFWEGGIEHVKMMLMR